MLLPMLSSAIAEKSAVDYLLTTHTIEIVIDKIAQTVPINKSSSRIIQENIYHI